VTDRVRALLPDVPAQLAAMRQPLWARRPPVVATGPHCEKPHVCEFYEHCHAGGPEHPVSDLPGADTKLRRALAELGIDDIRHIPADFPGLKALQHWVCEALRIGQRHHDPAIADVLTGLTTPVHFLDFETFASALPVLPGTSPYEAIPFQWSVHTLLETGEVRHQEYLHDGADDPRPRLTAALLEALGSDGTVVAYSGYEKTCLSRLEAALPELAADLARVRERLFDLLPAIRTQVYDPAFRGSFSIKKVLPALVPDLGYDDLEIRDGSVASLAYEELRDPATAPERATALRRQLLDYCRRDTEAMLELFRALC
jgi:hypothetical protein